MNFSIMGLLGLTSFISIMITALRCDLSRPWHYFNENGTTCTDLVCLFRLKVRIIVLTATSQINRWQTVAAFDILTEVILAAASVYLVYALQMDWSKKISVIFAFDLRLLVIVPIALRLHYFSRSYDTGNPTLLATNLTICTQVQLAMAICLASVPTLRPFVMATATNYGAPAEGARTENHTASGGSFNLRNIASRLRKNASHKDTQNSQMSTQNDEIKRDPAMPGSDDYHSVANVTGGRSRQMAPRGSDDSKEAIISKNGIHKETRYVVEYGDQR